MKDKTQNILLAIATIVTAFLLLVMQYQNNHIQYLKGIINNIDTTTIIKTDTVYKTQILTDTVPKYITKTIIKTDTMYQVRENDTIQHTIQLKNKTFSNTLQQDKDTITYKAYISGYDMDEEDYPRLDSIKLHTATKTITEHQETILNVKTPQKVRKWHFQPSLGVGYGLIHNKVDAYLGISLSYDIF